MNRTMTMPYLLAGIVFTLTLGAASRAGAAGQPVAVTNGGGVGVFSDPNNGCFGSLTFFGLGVTIRSDGSASGHFECNFAGNPANPGGKGGKNVGGGQLYVEATSGSPGPGDSVTFSGPATVHFAGGETIPLGQVSVTTTAGGPGVGTFNFCPSVCDPNSACDLETVVNGSINIHTP